MQTKTVGQLTALSSIASTDKLLVEQGGVAGYGTPAQLIAGAETVILEQAIPDTPTVQDISASNQTTDLTVYETGGASEKTTGYTIFVIWKDGDSTYYHKFSSGGDFYNQFFPTGQTPGDASSTFAWCGYGTGGLKLRLRENLTDWDVLTDGCFDRGSNSTGAWEQFTSKKMIQTGSDSRSLAISTGYLGGYRSSGVGVSTAIDFSDATYQVMVSVGQAIAIGMIGYPSTASNFIIAYTSVSSQAAATRTCYFTLEGEWRD